MRQILITILALLAAGCGQKRTASTVREIPGSLAAIQKIVGEQLKRSPEEIYPDATFSSLGADDLDFVEIVMATEEGLKVLLDDDSLTKAAGAASPAKLGDTLTVRAFATFADRAPRAARRSTAQSKEPNDAGLRAAQVGTLAELSKLPNPRGYELVFVPGLEEITRMAERRLGRTLTPEEQAGLKAGAVVLAMTPEEAQELRQKRLPPKSLTPHE